MKNLILKILDLNPRLKRFVTFLVEYLSAFLSKKKTIATDSKKLAVFMSKDLTELQKKMLIGNPVYSYIFVDEPKIIGRIINITNRQLESSGCIGNNVIIEITDENFWHDYVINQTRKQAGLSISGGKYEHRTIENHLHTTVTSTKARQYGNTILLFNK